jgi:hypothetical protein
MCFSASASFIASGVLAAIGLASIVSIKSQKWLFIALIPLFFAIQQFAEGLVWAYGSYSAALVFLFFAFIVWPFFIPFACLMAESDNRSRRWLYMLAIMGCGVSLCLLFGLMSSEVTFNIQGCHVVYDAAQGLLEYGYLWLTVACGYCVATIMPFFVSSHRQMKIMGFLVGSSCLIAYLFYTVYFISVWCFFAALISSAVVYIIRTER